MPNCTHWFHKPCLVQWLKTARTCPTCRAPVEAGRERERNIFGRPRLRISPGGTAPLAVRVRNDSAATNTSQRREGPSRPLPPFRTVDISDGEEDTVLVERRRRSPWRPTFGAPAQPTPWSNPGAAASRGASESWHDSGNTAGRSAPAPNNNTSGTAWSTSAAEPGWHVHDAWGATADVRDNGAAGPGGGASGGRSGGTGGVARNEGEGDGNAQTSRARSPWYTQNHWGSLDGSWPRGPW
ncbi:uncharacterized protein PHACADRAFT_259318 [Phanerochaete carnosa HHB-10118-sp]|uniref:RING-type domain-containing protein n=1 Tax=Phanerochaete carnosa (strain HHB-10118-sp) TaxID=650164 RepID=K5W1Y4_PHACS|nr:uncharacterized protein PHACADRAFT_259318 [Phanerochaete carnosa HHB-10118-sp]EKM53135.1 hypothetical protein PHACADRAFT_259318 [Phanerochaete carnosa HHB-10118-sp]